MANLNLKSGQVGRRNRRLRWWIAAVGLSAVIFVLYTRTGSETGPGSVPVEVDDTSARFEAATLEDALRLAQESLARMDAELVDYTGRLVKRERVEEALAEEAEMQFKIRTSRPPADRFAGAAQAEADGSSAQTTEAQSFSVYLKFLRPASVAGREVIWVENRNRGKLVAHEAGLAGLIRFNLDPTGWAAMRGNRYPIYEIGFQNLVQKLIERGEKLQRAGGAEVAFIDGFRVDDRECLLIQVRPRAPRAGIEMEDPAIAFWLAEIAIDRRRGVPLRYAAYGVPENPDSSPPLLEEYTYRDVRLNVGLSDADFDPDNPAYGFP